MSRLLTFEHYRAVTGDWGEAVCRAFQINYLEAYPKEFDTHLSAYNSGDTIPMGEAYTILLGYHEGSLHESIRQIKAVTGRGIVQ
jgi:hypothetical protein